MKLVMRVETSDGALHKTVAEAERAVNKRYGDALTAIVLDACKTEGKYTKLHEFIDANLPRLENLARIKDDLKLDKNELEIDD